MRLIMNATILAASGGAQEPAQSGHRYWRVFDLDGQNTGYFAIAELEMMEEAGGSNLTSTAFTIEGGERSGFEAVNAFDGIVAGNNAWGYDRTSSPEGFEPWVGQDFGDGNAKEIVEIAISARDDVFANQTPKDFDVQYSDDGTNWVTALSVVGEPNWGQAERRTFSIT